MKPAKPNNFGITHADYATDMRGADLRTQLGRAKVGYRETALDETMGVSASILSYISPHSDRCVSVLIVLLYGLDSWCEEYYAMVGTDHESALTRTWSEILSQVRQLYQP